MDLKKYIEDNLYKFNRREIANLILSTNDTEYIKFCATRTDIEFERIDRIKMIYMSEDIEFMKSCIRDLKLSAMEKTLLIKKTEDVEYIKKCVKDQSLELDDKNIANLIISLKSISYIDECLATMELSTQATGILKVTRAILDTEETRKENVPKQLPRSIDLPQGMTIGVEIESEGEFSKAIQGINIEGWKGKEDFTLVNGVEVVSPVLTGSKRDSENIYMICNLLKSFGQDVSQRCGGHIHIGADYLRSKEDYVNLITIWGNTEEILYLISNRPYELIRNGAILGYAEPISRKIQEALNRGTINIETEEDLEQFTKALYKVQRDRSSGINFENVNDEENRTIEFRLPNGTLDPNVWIENINLFGGLVKAAKEPENELLRGLADKNKSNEELLEILLQLTVSEDKRDIYRKRYQENSKLLEENYMVASELRARISENKIER